MKLSLRFIRYLSTFTIGLLLGIYYQEYKLKTQHNLNKETKIMEENTHSNKIDKKNNFIRIDSFSKQGLPIVIFTPPRGDKPDYTRVPTEDKITPKNQFEEKKASRKILGTNESGSYSSKETTIPPGTYLPLHRHPIPRIVYNTNKFSLLLHRQNQDGTGDVLRLEPGEFAIFAPDESGKFHNDFNPTKETAIVIVIELDTYKHSIKNL